MENVFIAWSKSRSLADSIACKLKESGINPIVGGGLPQDMFVGNQIVSQMDSCNFAMILIQKKGEIGGVAEFNDNVMFEWGYLLAKLGNRKIFVFLIDTSERELPSDLVGSWVMPVSKQGRSDEQLAEEIAGKFAVEHRAVDKIEIMSKWRSVKNVLLNYSVQHHYTDFEIAQFVLVSVFAAYYYNDFYSLKKLCSKIETRSRDLSTVLLLVGNKAEIYERTNTLSKPLGIEDYFEISTALGYEFEDGLEEGDLSQWVAIIRKDALSLASYAVSLGMEGDSRQYYVRNSIDIGHDVLKLIAENVEQHPENQYFGELLQGLQHRNIAIAHRELGEEEAAKRHFELSAKTREALYFFYKQYQHADQSLCSKFAQEYYLAQLERCAYEMNPMEKQRIIMTVNKYISTWEDEFVRQRSLLQMVKNAYAKAV